MRRDCRRELMGEGITTKSKRSALGEIGSAGRGWKLRPGGDLLKANDGTRWRVRGRAVGPIKVVSFSYCRRGEKFGVAARVGGLRNRSHVEENMGRGKIEGFGGLAGKTSLQRAD